MTFLAYLALQFLAGIGATICRDSVLVLALWGAGLWYGMLYFNGVIAEKAFKKVGENG
jgi:hypothetical protein